MRDDAEVVAHQHGGEAEFVAERSDQVEDAALGDDVEAGRRLVEDEDLRTGGDGHGDGDALLLAAGELVRVAAGEFGGAGQADLFEEVHDGYVAARLRDLPSDPHGGGERVARVLRDHGDGPSPQPPQLPCGRANTSDPSTRTEPPVTRDPCRRCPSSVAATVDLPLPDSPTSAWVCPGSTSSDTSRTDGHIASARARDRPPTTRVTRDDRGHQDPSLIRSTPHALERPSAARLSPTTSVARAMIGARLAIGTTVMAVRFSATIRPQSGVGGSAPKPRKDSEEISSTTHEARIANSTQHHVGDVRQDLAPEDRPGGLAPGPRRGHVVGGHDRQRGAAHDAYDLGDVHDGDREDDDRGARAQRGDDDQQRQDRRHRQHRVEDPPQHVVEPAAAQRRGTSHDRADQQGHERRGDGDAEGVAAAVQDACEDVTAVLVGACPVLPARPEQRLVGVVGDRVVRGERPVRGGRSATCTATIARPIVAAREERTVRQARAAAEGGATGTAGAAPGCRGWSSGPPARTELGVEGHGAEVGGEVAGDVDDRADQCDGLDDGQVPVLHGGEHQLADARVVEDVLDDRDSAGQPGDVQRDDVQRREQRAGQRVPGDDAPGRQALESGRGDVLARHDVDDGRCGPSGRCTRP